MRHTLPFVFSLSLTLHKTFLYCILNAISACFKLRKCISIVVFSPRKIFFPFINVYTKQELIDC